MSPTHRTGVPLDIQTMRNSARTLPAEAAELPAPDGLEALIEECLTVTGILPPYDHLVDLDIRLRAAAETLLPEAQAAADKLNRGTSEWWSRQSAIDYTRQVMADDLGSGLRSAAVHVAELARRCNTLREGRR
jgi:hypothetical protein